MTEPSSLGRLIRASAWTALAYVVAGELALWLAGPPAFAAPLYPAAGLALAAALVWGWRAWPGVLLGALLVNGLLGGPRGLAAWPALLSAASIAWGAMAQAALGAWLVRLVADHPDDLSEPRDALVLFGLGGLLACTVSAAVACGSLWLFAGLPASALPETLWAWWSGDALGVMVATPLTLTLIGQPRSLWATRRLTVGLPMLIMVTLLALAASLISRSDERRRMSLFERDASRAAAQLEAGLRAPLQALEAVHGLYVASDDVSAEEFRRATVNWLRQTDHLTAIGFSARVPKPGVATFEAQVQRADQAAFHVHDRADTPASLTHSDPDVVAIQRIEPLATNLAARGVNALSIPAARAAIEQAAATDRPTATQGFQLSQALGNPTGVVIYQAIHRGETPGTPAQRRAGMAGVVFVTLRTDDAVQALLAAAPAYLQWCLVDTAPGVAQVRLAGSPGCEQAAMGSTTLAYRRSIDFADRQWSLLVRTQIEDLPRDTPWTVWLLSVTGLLCTAMLGALLLSITGRARRIETAVAARTADLRREVQERRRTEQALRDSEQRWRNIVDHMPVGVLYANLDGQLREANPALCAMLGRDAIELCRDSLFDLLSPEDLLPAKQVLSALAGQLQSVARPQWRMLRANGEQIQVRLSLSLLKDSLGQPHRLAGVVEDITEHLQLADAERARERAEAASRAKSEFLSRMSHELRTPLNAILGFSQLLSLDKEPALSDRQRGWTEQVQRAGWHLLSLINEMLDLSRIEAGHLHLNLSALPASRLLQECMGMVEPTAQTQGGLLDRPTGDNDLVLWADATRTKQVLTNLLSNAVKYNRPGGHVRCEWSLLATGQVQIRIRDEGPGFSADQAAGLFQPFNRLGREGGPVEGTGLGLVISKRLTEAMGGSLEAHSLPGQGAVFTLSLPAADVASEGPAAAPDLSAMGVAAYRQRRVHYIEDNETNAEVMRGILTRRPQVQLLVSATGEAGLAAIQADPPDLILLDMHLPDMDGLQVLRRLAADDRLVAIPVLVVSADATPDRMEQAFALGAADYATKPVEVSSFLAQLDSLLERQESRFS
jgi:PAS domain S-box-containing protein